MRRFRKFAFLVFVAIYLVSCPLVLLQAFGYSLQPGAEQGIVKTGLIYLATTPPGATVYLGRRRYTNVTPTTLRGLRPGSYDLRLALPGHQTWARTIPVEAEKSTVLDRVMLLPVHWNPQRLLPGPFQDLLPLPGTRLVLVRGGPTLADYTLYDWRAAEAKRLVSLDSPLAESRVMSLWTVPGSTSVLLRLAGPMGVRMVWIEPPADEPRLEDLTGFLPEGIRHLAWDPLDRRHLFFLKGGTLVRFHLPSKTMAPLLERVVGFGLAERTLFVLDESRLLVQTDLDGKRRTPEEPAWLALPPEEPVRLSLPWAEHRSMELKSFANDKILLLGGRGELLAPRVTTPLIERGALGLAWDPHHQRALVWERERLGVVDWSDPEKTPHLRWVFAGGRRITQAFWAHQGSHVLFHDEDRVRLLELQPPESPIVHELFTVRAGSPFAYDDEAGMVFYLEPAGGTLCAAALLPRRDLLNFVTP